MNDLLPCPFCGDSAILGGLGGFHEVECTNCNAITNYTKSEAEAVALWNQRVDAARDGTNPSALPAQHAASAASEIGRILFRRAIQQRLDGYTLETAQEIADALNLRESVMSLALQEMLIRHYGTPAEKADQIERYGLSDAELSCAIESEARAALEQETVSDERDGVAAERSAARSEHKSAGRDSAWDALRKMSAAMAEDYGLWFKAETCAEAYVQQELRKLCAAIEGVSPEECAIRSLKQEGGGGR
jgi:Lar family restriction alleviation protein